MECIIKFMTKIIHLIYPENDFLTTFMKSRLKATHGWSSIGGIFSIFTSMSVHLKVSIVIIIGPIVYY